MRRRTWQAACLCVLLGAGVAQAAWLREDLPYPAEPFSWKLADLIQVYGPPTSVENGDQYIWTERRDMRGFGYVFPDPNGSPTLFLISLRCSSAQSARSFFLQRRAAASAQLGMSPVTRTRNTVTSSTFRLSNGSLAQIELDTKLQTVTTSFVLPRLK